MSKRITFNNFEIEQLVKGLEALRDQINMPYESIRVGRRFYQVLIDKLSPPIKLGDAGYAKSQREK
jgi:hypothetical protein